jgi:hypothetical protein
MRPSAGAPTDELVCGGITSAAKKITQLKTDNGRRDFRSTSNKIPATEDRAFDY